MKKVNYTCMNPIMVPIEKIQANDYNPNKVATSEMKYLIYSIETFGLAYGVTAVYQKDIDKYIVVDGFHRFTVLKNHFKVKEVPVIVLDLELDGRMSATVAFNEARGKHQVDLTTEMVVKMVKMGLSDQKIAKITNMSAEELLRFKGQSGIPELFKNEEFSRSWIKEEV